MKIIISSWLVTHRDGGCRKPTIELRYCGNCSTIKLKSIISKANTFSIAFGWHMPGIVSSRCADNVKIQFGCCRVAVAVSFCAMNVSDGVNERRSLFSLRDKMRSHHTHHIATMRLGRPMCVICVCNTLSAQRSRCSTVYRLHNREQLHVAFVCVYVDKMKKNSNKSTLTSTAQT